MQPTESQKQAVFDEFLEHEFVTYVERQTSAGMMGEQFNIVVGPVDAFHFNLYVEDVALNMEWAVVEVATGRYESGIEVADNELLLTVEVRRWP